MGQFNTIPPNPFPPSSEKVGDAVEIEKDITSIKEDITSLKNGLIVNTTLYNNVTVNAGSRQWLGNVVHGNNKICTGYCDNSQIVVYITSVVGEDTLQAYAYNPTSNAITANMGINVLG